MKDCCKNNRVFVEEAPTAGYDKDGNKIAKGRRRVMQCTKCGAKHHIVDIEPLRLHGKLGL